MALILRTCDKDGKSYGGFQWPLTVGATVTAPDWDPTPECGHGLHGALWGEGNGELLSWESGALWLVVEADDGTIVPLGGKVKFPSGVIRFIGSRLDATNFLRAQSTQSLAIIGGTSTSGDRGTSTSGDGGTSTSGDRGTSTSGDGGTSTSGYRGTSISGDYGTSTSGDGGTSTSGDGGTLIITWSDGSRYRLAVGYVGENGIKPNTPYRLNDRGEFVEVTQ